MLFLHLLDHPILAKTIPSKLFDYLYYNKPVLAGIRGEGKDIIENLGCGLVFEPEDVEALVKSIKTIRDNYLFYLEKSSNNRSHVKKYYNRRENFRTAFEKILTDLEVGINSKIP